MDSFVVIVVIFVMGVLIALLLAGCIWFHAELEQAEADVRAYRKVVSLLQQKADKKIQLLESELAWWKRQVNNQVIIKSPFNEDQLKTLINLCHPDRHGGKQSAVEITQILLSLRNNR